MRVGWIVLWGLLVAGDASAETLIVANKSDDTVDLLSLDSGESLATLPTGHAPHEVAVSADGKRAIVTNYGDRERPGSSLTLIDLDGAKVVRTIELGEHRRPHGIAWISPSKSNCTNRSA